MTCVTDNVRGHRLWSLVVGSSPSDRFEYRIPDIRKWWWSSETVHRVEFKTPKIPPIFSYPASSTFALCKVDVSAPISNTSSESLKNHQIEPALIIRRFNLIKLLVKILFDNNTNKNAVFSLKKGTVTCAIVVSCWPCDELHLWLETHLRIHDE